jgi:hypothetical protein
MRASIRILGPAAVVLALAAAVAGPLATRAQTPHDHHAVPQAAPTKAPRPITMEELHRLGGTPRGWKFTLPDGDPARGKQVFADAGCFQCHAMRGAGFPEAGADRKPGPDLTGMGGRHSTEYLAESILTPNAVILDGPGYLGPDGLSIMPSYADSLSVRQLLDVVAYLPVTLTLKTEGQRPRTVRLEPMVSAQGFHYGADLTIPDEVDQVDVSIRPTTMKVMDSARGRFTRRVTASVPW